VVSFAPRLLYPRGQNPVSTGWVGLRAGLVAEGNKNVLPLPRIEPTVLLVTKTVSIPAKIATMGPPPPLANMESGQLSRCSDLASGWTTGELRQESFTFTARQLLDRLSGTPSLLSHGYRRHFRAGGGGLKRMGRKADCSPD
jgi:hypothetical protein